MNKFAVWIKSLSWIVVTGIIWAAISMILNARRAGALEVEVAQGEARIKMLEKGSIVDIQAARKLQNQIGAKKIDARLVRKKSEKSLERLGQHETMADIADRFNSKSGRVRSRKDSAAEF